MGKKALIMYSSYTGNTEKVALRFKSVFEKHGWECDTFKIRKKAEDILNPPVDLDNYDFLCVGSGIILHLPYNEILNVLRKLLYGTDPRSNLKLRDEGIPYIKGPVPKLPRYPKHEEKFGGKQLAFGPNCKKAVAFVTLGGTHFDLNEAEPSLQLLALEVEHLGFKCIGQFPCIGGMKMKPPKDAPEDAKKPEVLKAIPRDRPNERDLLKAEIFMEEKLEEAEREYYFF